LLNDHLLDSDGDWGLEIPTAESFILTKLSNQYNDPAQQMMELENTIKSLESIYLSSLSDQLVEHVDKELLIPFPLDFQIEGTRE
jgi:hypothetical protein